MSNDLEPGDIVVDKEQAPEERHSAIVIKIREETVSDVVIEEYDRSVAQLNPNCEHGLYLEKVGKVEVEATGAMKRRTKNHEKHHGDFRSRAEETELILEQASADDVERARLRIA